MSDKKAYFLLLGIIFVSGVLVKNYTTIFPVCSEAEYFIDEYGNIHSDNCPYKSPPWFTRKYNKYDILIGRDQEICEECLYYEKDKLWALHYINIDLNEKLLRINGATEEYIEKRRQEYK